MKIAVHFIIRVSVLLLSGLIACLAGMLPAKGLQATGELTIIFIALILWAIFIIYESCKLHKEKKASLRNTNIALILSLLIILSITYCLVFTPVYLYSKTSPGGRFKISVYEKPKFFSPPGDSSTRCAFLVLYDRNGRKLRETCESCPAFINDIEIIWDIENGYVQYARGAGLELSEGKCK